MDDGALDPEADPPFPESLADVTEGPHLFETFGLGPSLVAVALASADVYFLVGAQRAALDAAEVVVLLLLFAGVLGCVAHEVRRRQRRAVIVIADGSFGIYREGQLCGSLTAQNLTASRAHEPVSAKGVLGLVFVAVMFLGYGLSEEGGPAARIVALGPGVWLMALGLSFARAAWLCESFHLPGSRAKALLSRSELTRVGRMLRVEM